MPATNRIELIGSVALDELSIAQAQRLTGISRQALRAAIADGRLEAWPARRRWHDPKRPVPSVRWRTSRDALERFIACCPPCAWPGCGRPGVTPTGRCSLEHKGWVGRRHTAESRAKMAVAKKGVPLQHAPEWNERIGEAKQRFYDDSDRSQANRRQLSEQMMRAWETGEGAAGVAVAKMHGGARSRWRGRWAARKRGRVGGRERGYTDLQAKGVLRCKRENPTLGRHRLAELSGLTERQVRAILDEAADVPSTPGG
jgi:hypothetical protein